MSKIDDKEVKEIYKKFIDEHPDLRAQIDKIS